MRTKLEFANDGTVALDARTKLRSRATQSGPASLTKELEEIDLLIDKGYAVEAQARLVSLISGARKDPELLAHARMALSVALEMLGEYRHSLEAVAMYEAPEARATLSPELSLKLLARLALAYNYNGDHPKAIGLLNAALRENNPEAAEAPAGVIYTALARVYRGISEYPIARDYSQRAREAFRQTGDWRGLAEAYFGIAIADNNEGRYESAIENFQQALKLIGDHPATFLLAKININIAGAYWSLKQPHEGIRCLEKAIKYYEATEHRIMAAEGLNNLAINLLGVGQWDRAQEALERASAIATELHDRWVGVSMLLDSRAMLHMNRGELEEATTLAERAVANAREIGHKWYECQALRTTARCHLATGATKAARSAAQDALELAERIGDLRDVPEAQVLLAECCLQAGDLDGCLSELSRAALNASEFPADLALAGEVQRMRGMSALAQSDPLLAARHFGSCVSIFELLGYKYPTGRSHFDLGRTYAIAQPELATEHLTRAVNIFRELGAKLDLQRAEAALKEHQLKPEKKQRPETAMPLSTLRLADAVASRQLLLRELAALIRQVVNASRVIILEVDEEQRHRVVVAHGCDNDQATRIAEEFASATDESAQKKFAQRHDAKLITLSPANSLPATLLISPQGCGKPLADAALDPLLRVTELGMDVCALRARATTAQNADSQDGSGSTSVMPGFIHSSPAMTRVVEEISRIRSSDVTVLVTGESGTGKEVVARAIHALSSRRDKTFVPFNCTAMPKELSESYLFGHRRGAFTGAVDSVGVIRSAAGGTLFIDEIGDLPLDVQPKLLRFLQEGEIQPLGEQKPIQIDVRIIAATNTDLEELVAQGRFREDLYYRLNVIRLRVPPLRERRSEIPALVSHYVNHYSSKFGRQDIQTTPQAVDLLMVAEWPGNVRQLCNEIQRVVARAENGTLITPEHLSPELRQMSAPTAPPGSEGVLGRSNIAATLSPQNATLAEALEEVERRLITEVVSKHQGNISRAARELGVTRRGLYLKIERYKINAGPSVDKGEA